jgi:SAM-dependent methyltransferase
MEDKSHLTAITRKSFSAPVQYMNSILDLRCMGRSLDYGCGKGFDAETLGFEKYDPYFFPEMPEGVFDFIMCNYVLNVVDEESGEKILEKIMEALDVGGICLISVRRDVKQDGFTSRGTYQRNVILDWPLFYEQHGRFAIYQKMKEVSDA